MNSTYTLGMHNSWQSGAALLCDGVIIAAASEERFTREKDCSGIPGSSIKFVLNRAGISISEVDKIAYGMTTSITPDALTLATMLERGKNLIDFGFRSFRDFADRLTSEMRWNEKYIKELFDWARSEKVEDKIVQVDHHTAHAAGAFFTSGFDESFVITLDGKGNFRSGSIFIASLEKGLVPLDFKLTFDSLGYFYGNVTRALGFKSERHEGKITGLAAYGNPLVLGPTFRELLLVDPLNPDFSLKWSDFYKPWFLDEQELVRLFELARTHSREDFAAGAQWALEKIVIDYVDHVFDKYGTRKRHNLCVSGGIFANVKLNQKLSELNRVDGFYVQPAMGDMGIPLGSALYVQELSLLKKRFNRVPMMNLGPSLEEGNEVNLKIEDFLCGQVLNPKELFSILMDLNLAVG